MIKNQKIEEILEDINSGKIALIDIRTPLEWGSGCIENSRKICFIDENGMYDLNDFIKQIKPILNNQQIALICRSGRRSIMLANMLDSVGIDSINVLGGIESAKKKIK